MSTDLIKIIWPVIVIQVLFQLYALIDVARARKTKNLSVVAWVIIIIVGEILGPILYFLIGKSEE